MGMKSTRSSQYRESCHPYPQCYGTPTVRHAQVLHRHRGRCLLQVPICGDASLGSVGVETNSEALFVECLQRVCRDNG